MIGLSGVLCALALVLFGDTRDLRFVWGDDVVVVLLAGPSAWLAGLAVAGLMGRDGGWGWFGGFVGYTLATVLGAGGAGTILAPVFGTLAAPAILLDQVFAEPILAAVWMTAFLALQKISMIIRA